MSNDTLSILCGHMHFTVSDDTPYALSDITNFAMPNNILSAWSSNMRTTMPDNVYSAMSAGVGIQRLVAYVLYCLMYSLHCLLTCDLHCLMIHGQ